MEEARIEWRNSQCDKLEDVPERQKWRIINTLTNNESKTQVQPIRKKRSDGSSEYLFEDKEILSEMEKYHIEKNDGSFIDDMGARQVVEELRDSEK